MEEKTYFIPVTIHTEAIVIAKSLKEAYAITKIESIPSIDQFVMDYSREASVSIGCEKAEAIKNNKEYEMSYYKGEMGNE